MEIINIEKKTFENMMLQFEMLSQKVNKLTQQLGEKTLKQWYDNLDVCEILRISPRKLQTLRDNGTIAYSQFNRKIYYKPQDIENVIEKVRTIQREDERKQILNNPPEFNDYDFIYSSL